MERAYDILGIGFFIIAGATALVILILGVLNFTRARPRRTPIVVQALAALAIWTVLTLVIFFANIFYMVAFEYAFMQGQGNPLESPATTAIVIGVSFLIYALAGGGLIYWTRRQTKRFQAAP
jgi:type VI protein secretion system component VasK